MVDTYSGPFASAKTRIPSPVAGDLVAMDGNGDLVDAGVASTTNSASNDNSHVPTTAAMQSAIAAALTGGGTFQGGWDASGGTFPTLDHLGAPIAMGDFWTITVGGTLPGPQTVFAGDQILALVNVPGQTPGNWSVSVGTGVRSFKGRVGTVVPVTGDYDISQVTDGASLTYVNAQLGLKSDLTYVNSQLALKSNLASPTFTGVPAAPTASPGTSTTQLATTDFVTSADNLKADIASPTFTGIPAAPTAAPGTNTTQIATTAFVQTAAAAGVTSFNTRTGAVVPTTGDYSVAQVTGAAPLASPTFTGVPAAPTASPGTSTTQLATTAFVAASAAAGVTSFNARTGAVIPQTSDYSVAQVTGAAPLASPALTGNPTAPTQTAGDNSTRLATTAYTDTGLALKANIASPTFTGVPAAPTAAPGTTTTQLATTAFVSSAVSSSVTSFNTRTGAVVPTTGDYSVAQVTGAAPLASPALTGNPTAPTQSANDNSTKIATTAYVDTGLALKSNIASPTFTGVPAAPTAAPGTNTTQLATTAFVAASAAAGVTSFNTRTGAVVPATNDYSFSQISGTAAATQGGTGQSSYTTGDILFANSSTSLSRRAAVAIGQVFVSQGVGTPPDYSASPSATSFTASGFFALSSNGFTNKLNTSSLSGNQIFNLPNAASNSVQPSSGTTNQFATGINSSGVISYAQPTISTDVQKSTFITPVTTATEVVVAVAPLQNADGYYILSISDSNLRQLTICFHLTANKNYLGYPPTSSSPYAAPSLVICSVNDTQTTITAANIFQYFTFMARLRTASPNPYVAVTVRMSGGLLNGAGAYTYTCTSYAESFLSDNTTITQYVSQNYANLAAVAASTPYLINTTYTPPVTTYGASLYLFCVNFGTTTLNMYTINTLTGLLANNSPSTLTIGSAPRTIITSKDGKYAYATNSVSTNIQMMLLDLSTGVLTNNTTATISAGTNPSYMAIHPEFQNYLYVTNRGSNSLGCYALDRSTGLLSPLSPATVTVGPAGSNPVGVVLTSPVFGSATFLYVAANVDANVYMFSVNPASGALTPLGTPTIARVGAYHLVLHPNGLFLYCSSDNNSQITVFSINTSTGQLTNVQNAASGNTTREMAITPNGAFLYALNNGANNIQEYSVSLITGQLSNLGTVALTNPTSIKMSPSGLYLYVSAGTANTVNVYSINQNTGLLTSIGSIAAGTTTAGITII